MLQCGATYLKNAQLLVATHFCAAGEHLRLIRQD